MTLIKNKGRLTRARTEIGPKNVESHASGMALFFYNVGRTNHFGMRLDED